MTQYKNGRIGFVSALILLTALFFIVKLFYVQILRSEKYRELANTSYVQSKDTFERGIIFFTKKDGIRIGAATVTTGFRVVVNPSVIDNAQAIFENLKKIIPDLDESDFLSRASKKNDPYEIIATRIPKSSADQIEALLIPGVSIEREKWRFYPGGELASHSIGFVSFKGDDLIGQYGIERQYNGTLSRKEDELYVNPFAEIFSNIRKNLFTSGEKEGDLITTIEPNVERFLESKLKEVQEKWNGASAGGIIINPQNGEIYAMAYTPTFDLNKFGDIKDVAMFSNPLVEHVYEFGSVVKPLVMASALDAGVVTPETTYYDGGSVKVGIETIHNFDKKGRGTVNMQEVLNQSLNTGMVFVMQQVGKDKLKEYLISYGIGEKTGIDLPNETSGLISNLESKREIEYATVAFGQGIAITPIEAVRAFSILANGGTKITPHLVKEIKYEKGGGKEIKYPPSDEQIIKKDTSKEITRMLVEIVDTALFNGKEKMEHYSIAAKTGTAQIANKSGGGYYEDRYLHSFFGYFPAYDPDFLVLLYAIDPKGVRYSSQTLAPPFMETAKFLLNYYEIP